MSSPECRAKSRYKNPKQIFRKCQFRYLEATVTNQNLIQMEIKRRLNSGNPCYHSDQNTMLRRIFRSKRNEVTGEWRKLHKEELHDLYSSPSTIRIFKSIRIRWAVHVVRMREKGNVNRLLVRKPERKMPLEKSRRRWVDNIKMDFVEIW
jgi:hypothetical protein